MQRRHGYNPKRKIAERSPDALELLNGLARKASYSANAEHKLHAGDYGLKQVRNPRPGKTLCDADRHFPKEDAEQLLKRGLERGMVSVQMRNGWPQNVW